MPGIRLFLNTFFLGIFFGSFSLYAETINFYCQQRNPRYPPNAQFLVRIYSAESRDAKSEIYYRLDSSSQSSLLSGFAKEEVYQTLLTDQHSHLYRQITIHGARFSGAGTLQLQKRNDREYRGIFYFPEGSQQLSLAWGSNIFLICKPRMPIE